MTAEIFLQYLENIHLRPLLDAETIVLYTRYVVYVLLMMGAMDARNMQSNLAVNKYLHTVASRWIYSTYGNAVLYWRKGIINLLGPELFF